MRACPHCHQPVASQAIVCPHCRTALKAHGHPGMTLHRATGGEPLCLSCLYHADDSCTFPKRPTAMDCTLYRDRQPQPVSPLRYSPSVQIKIWMARHSTGLLVLGLLVVSLLVVLWSK